MAAQLQRRPVRGTWVQTERAAHEAWAGLISRQPRAAALLHLLVANMDQRGGLVASQATLAQLMGVSTATIKRALTVLTDELWIEVVRLGSERGGVNVYVVNRRVAWADKRDNQRYAAFDARILVSESEQSGPIPDDLPPLKQIPSMAPGEGQLPHGEGLPPPSQPSMAGMEPDLPAVQEQPDPWAEQRKELERRDAAGIPRSIPDRDPNTIDWVDDHS